jgi:hypothetical protein
MKYFLKWLLILGVTITAVAQNQKISQLPAGSPAQTTDIVPIARGGSNYSLTAAQIAALGPDITTVSGLASVPGKTKGTVAVVTDGTSGSDCATGGSSIPAFCQYSGSSWAAVAGSGTVTSVATGGIATGGPFTTSGTVTVAGSGNTTTAATATSGLASASANTAVEADGSGNIEPLSATGTFSLPNTTATSAIGTGASSPFLELAGTYFGGSAGTLAASTADVATWQLVEQAPVTLSGTTDITHVAESSGNVVTLTLASSPFGPGQLVEISGLSAATWLNGYVVSVTTGTAITMTFTDPTSHGTLSSTVLTGTPEISQVSGLGAMTLAGSNYDFLQVPNGSPQQPGLTFASAASGTGFSAYGAGVHCWYEAGTAADCLNSGGLEVNENGSFSFSETPNASGAIGPSYGVIGSGTTMDLQPSTFLLLPSCKLLAGVNMTVSGTAYTICSFTLPNAAASWAYSCQGTYTTTTSSDTFALGWTIAHAPTNVIANATIFSTQSGTQTFGTATSNATTNQTALTGASVSSVTAVPWTMAGVIDAASATSGTFLITGMLTGTSPSGTVNAGTTCHIE